MGARGESIFPVFSGVRPTPLEERRAYFAALRELKRRKTLLTDQDKERVRNSVHVLAEFERIRDRNRNIGQEKAAELLRATLGGSAWEGISLHYRTIRRMQERLRIGSKRFTGNLDSRGNPNRAARVEAKRAARRPVAWIRGRKPR